MGGSLSVNHNHKKLYEIKAETETIMFHNFIRCICKCVATYQDQISKM